jgi:hypothetical protein
MYYVVIFKFITDGKVYVYNLFTYPTAKLLEVANARHRKIHKKQVLICLHTVWCGRRVHCPKVA